MIVTFEENYLRALYEAGKTTNKKYRFQPEVIVKYKKRISTLLEADRVEDLFVIQIMALNPLSPYVRL